MEPLEPRFRPSDQHAREIEIIRSHAIRGIALAVVLAATFSYPSETYAEGQFYGPLRARDLSPFGFLRLDMRPAHAVSIEKGSFAIETEFAYQNTWALSGGVEAYLGALEAQGRRDLGSADVQAIQDLPGENYLIDLESALLGVTLHYKISENWTGYLTGNYISYQGGFMDGAIERFHDALEFSSYGRPTASRNDVNIIYDLKSTQLSSFGAPTSGGLADPTLGVRYIGLELPAPWKLALEAAVKIPFDGERRLLSTGHTDYGVQASAQRRGQIHALYVNAAVTYYAGADFPVRQDRQVIPTLILGYEHRMTERTNLNVQGYFSRSVHSHRQTDLEELLADKYQLSIGVRHRRNHSVFSFGVTENLRNFNNTPDIGIQFGVAYIPARIPAR